MNLTLGKKVRLKIEELFQYNPFNAVIIIKNDANFHCVTAMNDNAKQLFNITSNRQLAAADLFLQHEWLKLQHLAANPSEAEMTIHAIGTVRIYVCSFVIEEADYYYIVMDKQNCDQFAEHRQFVEQYKDPVVTIDLEGNILYVNLAAQQKMKIGTDCPILKWVKEAFQPQLRTLLKSTFDGRPMIIPNCVMNEQVYSDDIVAIQSFPTYWHGKIIGAHIIMKQVQLFFTEQNVFQQVAYQDELTGLLNRRALHEQWAAYENKASKLPIALLIIDIDRFKKFNESIGKQKTDELLTSVSERLCAVRSKKSELFHYSGDEFVVIMQDAKVHDIEQLAQFIQELLKQPFLIDEQEYFITVSIGISSIQRGELLDLKLLLHKANQALYYVKKHERGQYRHYSEEMNHEFSNEVLMEAHLRRAIEFNELCIHFQPQYNLLTEEINSFEALVRWNNRKFGAVPPNIFIALAETSELIIEIGDWILERVFQYLRTWREKGYRPMRVAVNISPKQFKHERFVEKVKVLLVEYEIEPQYLELEITEGSLMDVDVSTAILNELKALGVYVSVDDFGTGYSSLSYLKSYPIDIIKIDQSFIRDIEKDEKNEKIIKAIVLLSHTLGLEVVAEGVEKKSQEQFLRQLHCEKVQGFLYNKPAPALEIEQKFLKYQ